MERFPSWGKCRYKNKPCVHVGGPPNIISRKAFFYFRTESSGISFSLAILATSSNSGFSLSTP